MHNSIDEIARREVSYDHFCSVHEPENDAERKGRDVPSDASDAYAYTDPPASHYAVPFRQIPAYQRAKQ